MSPRVPPGHRMLPVRRKARLLESPVREQLAGFRPGIARHFGDHNIHSLGRTDQSFDRDPRDFANEGTLLLQRAAGVHFQM